ncbi:hypothetical protein [Hymenobacter nivis]|uniref:hypothetical protein n=1 Tax=Hymenobacter nivis TaxID=1850093 RepID=UPI001375B754|nr:hypothetical protein [Hymenobacter nivis]
MPLDTKLPASYIFRGTCPALVRALLISSFFHLLKLSIWAFLPPVLLAAQTGAVAE